MKSISNEMLRDLWLAGKHNKMLNCLRREIVSCDFFDYSSLNDMFVGMRNYMSNFYSSKYHQEDITYNNDTYYIEDISFGYHCTIYMIAGDKSQDLTLKEIINAQFIP